MTRPPPRSTLFPYTTLFRSLKRTQQVHIVETVIDAVFGSFLDHLERAVHTDQIALHRTQEQPQDRKSTRLNSSHTVISYAVFCLKKKNKYESHYSYTRLSTC